MVSKCHKIRLAWAAGDRIAASRIAGRFFDRSVNTQIFKRGMDAYNRAGFLPPARQGTGANNARCAGDTGRVAEWLKAPVLKNRGGSLSPSGCVPIGVDFQRCARLTVPRSAA